MYDLRFRTPFTYTCAGPSQSGKTSHVFNILRLKEELFDVNPQNVLYFYNLPQPSFANFRQESPGIVTEWINKLPDLELLREKTLAYRGGSGSLVIIDDFVSELNADISNLFTVLSHSNNINVILLTQNLFSKNPVYRTISLNSTYTAAFKNPRDSAQITNFAKQFAPNNTRYIVEAFRECTKKPYSYLFFDHHQKTPDRIRVRSDILPHEGPMKVWIPKNNGF
jgi:hypothetical protein